MLRGPYTDRRPSRTNADRPGGGSVGWVIAHVALETAPADGPRAAAFWQQLGFEPVAAPPALRDRAAWFERSGTQIHLLWTDEPTVAPEGHVAVVVAEYDATLARLRAAGHTVESRTEHWGSPRSFAWAPGGHRVELMAAPPLSPRAGQPSDRGGTGSVRGTRTN
jgi:hypothetical protein